MLSKCARTNENFEIYRNKISYINPAMKERYKYKQRNKLKNEIRKKESEGERIRKTNKEIEKTSENKTKRTRKRLAHTVTCNATMKKKIDYP